MSNSRKNFSQADQTALVCQVDRICPGCQSPLFYEKNGHSYKNYDIAHIYPLNPKPQELQLLKDEELLSDDLNDQRNLIPLCKSCHGKYDKPRTVAEYRELVSFKKKIISRSGQEELWHRYNIENEIRTVIEAIYDNPDLAVDTAITFHAKEVNEKLDTTISSPTRRKITNNVRDYFTFIRDKFRAMDQAAEPVSSVISLQVKTYYTKQSNAGHNQQVIFENIVKWLNAKTEPDTIDGAEILASFFIQNCEIFE